MAINASAEAIRQMKMTLQKTIKEIERIQANVRGSMKSSENWNDAQGEQYRHLMQHIARLTESPSGTLRTAVPKLEKLAQILDAYGKVRF